MTQIKPFKAVYYNQSKIKDLSKVVCPPYDVISEREQIHYYNLSPYNFIHVLLGKTLPEDSEQNNQYTRAKETFQDWLQKGILMQDTKPSIYFYKQEYRIRGGKHNRLGFISLMRLEDEEANIYPHENTHSHAINDRFRLWNNIKANLSSIFVCFSDKNRKVQRVFNQKVILEPPFIDVVDRDGVKHLFWRLDDAQLIAEISAEVSSQHVFIADGHHRYKVAQEYRQFQLNKVNKANKVKDDAPFNYVMTYFTNMDSKDLQIFPVHRIIKKLDTSLDFLEESFRIDKVSSKENLFILLAKAGKNEHTFGLYTRDGIRLLRLKNKSLINQYVKEGSLDYQRLDVTILKCFILDRLGIRSEDIFYSQDMKDAVDMVDNRDADASFIMNPIRIEELKAIALNGERMPPKTTYFYPKVLSGLTVYKMK